MRQSFSIAVVLILIIILGMWGQYVLSPDQFGAHFSQRFYEVLSLFVLEGDWTDIENLPWQLEFTRIVAPLASIGGILIILTRGAWVELLNYFVRFRQEHVVVVSLNDRSRQFINSCLDHYKLVVVEEDPDNPLINRARSAGAVVIVGNILQSDMFDRVSLSRARHLVNFTEDDGTNVEVALKAREYISNGKAPTQQQLRIHVHLNDNRIAERLENYPKFFEGSSVAEVSFFSVFDLTTRMLFSRYPAEIFADAANRRQVHIALYNFGRLAESILIEAFRICHFANGSKLRFTIFDNEADRRESALRRDYPEIFELCELAFVNLPTSHTYSLHTVPEELFQSITQHIICFPTDTSLHLALTLRAHLLEMADANAPILVRMQQSSGMALLLESNVGAPEIPDGLYPFGMLDEVLNYENILSDKLDTLARVLHEDYLRRRQSVEADSRLYASLQEWQSLPEPKRKSNRLQGDHLALKMRAVSCAIAEGQVTQLEFTGEEAELLARMEHERWRNNMLFEGWSAGPGRVEGARINPYAVRWEEMDAEERLGNVEAIKRVPGILQERLSWGIRRQCLVGVTGHRLHKLDVDDPKVRDDVERALAGIVARRVGERIVIVSPLAEGADRLVARIAMEQFAMALWAPLPLPYELLQTDFASPGSVEEFKELVGKAEHYFELPMKFGSVAELAAHVDGTPNPARDRQYALAGAFVAQRCHELIAIYDGEPAGGEGGTAQVLGWRQSGTVPEAYRFTSDFFQQPELSEPIVISSNGS